jgi:hypothetical protein
VDAVHLVVAGELLDDPDGVLADLGQGRVEVLVPGTVNGAADPPVRLGGAPAVFGADPAGGGGEVVVGGVPRGCDRDPRVDLEPGGPGHLEQGRQGVEVGVDRRVRGAREHRRGVVRVVSPDDLGDDRGGVGLEQVGDHPLDPDA